MDYTDENSVSVEYAEKAIEDGEHFLSTPCGYKDDVLVRKVLVGTERAWEGITSRERHDLYQTCLWIWQYDFNDVCSAWVADVDVGALITSTTDLCALGETKQSAAAIRRKLYRSESEKHWTLKFYGRQWLARQYPDAALEVHKADVKSVEGKFIIECGQTDTRAIIHRVSGGSSVGWLQYDHEPTVHNRMHRMIVFCPHSDDSVKLTDMFRLVRDSGRQKAKCAGQGWRFDEPEYTLEERFARAPRLL